MKKKLLLLVAFATISLTAQTTVFFDDFNDENLDDWILLDEDGDTRFWGDLFTIENGSGEAVTPVSLISRSWSGSPLTPDNWASSPVIDLSDSSGLINLKFITQVAAESWDEEHYTIYVANASDITTLLAASVTFDVTLGDAGNTGTPVNQTYDISSMAGEANTYIAIRHHAVTDMDFVSIDDFTVEAASTVSVEENELSSQILVYPTTVDEAFTISNRSANTLNNVSIFDVNGRLIKTEDLNSLTGEKAINIANFSSGLYIVKLYSDAGEAVKKIIKN